ncbi:MAG: amidase [Acidimicrobiales bacterium]|nr:amidase [Acidimicrobiales bacterium]
MSLIWSDATAQAELVRSGQATPGELLEAAITRIEALDGGLNAVIHRRFERARVEADAVDRDAPFAGVPMVLKDLICELEDEPFHEGMAYLRDLDYRAPADQGLARRFKQAGFVVVGKSNTPELGGIPTTEPLSHGPTRNPWDRGRTPGGSSGGSAAAVATGMVAVGHANDAGGSIRNPAARCGLVGLKPSRGRISQGPLYGDVFGGVVAELAVTRTVRDTAALLDVLSAPFPGDPIVAPRQTDRYVEAMQAPTGALRIGVWHGIPGGFGELHPEAIAAVDAGAELLSGLGHAVEEAHPHILERRLAAAVLGRIVMASTVWAIRRWEKLTGVPCRPEQLEPITRSYVQRAESLSAADLLDLFEQRDVLVRALAAWFEQHDVLVLATVAEPAPELGVLQAYEDADVGRALQANLPSLNLTSWVNLVGLPAISLPLHWTADGLPMGTQLVAPYGREDRLLALAARLEQARPWAHRHPDRFGG